MDTTPRHHGDGARPGRRVAGRPSPAHLATAAPPRRGSLLFRMLVLTIATAAMVGSGASSGAAATSTSTIGATVASATSLSVVGCAPGTPAVTDFGTVLASSSNVTTADCVVGFGSSNDTAALRVVQADGSGRGMFQVSNGRLDTSFDPVGLDGQLQTDIAGGADVAYAAARQPDGKIIAAGSASGGATFAMVRYLPDGTPDPSFNGDGNGDGKIVTPMAAGAEQANDVLVQPDGKIILVGSATGGTSDFALARYDPDGSLDTTFSGDGKVVTDFSGGDDEAWQAALTTDGRILVGGSAHTGADLDFAIARYDTDGSLDTTFSGDGMHTTAIGPGDDDEASALLLQADGKAILVGTTWGAPARFSLARFDTAGALDPTFNGDGDADGLIAIPFGGAAGDWAYAATLQSDGKVVAAGENCDGAKCQWAVARYDATGALDPTFAGNGRTTLSFGSGAAGDWAFGVTQADDDRLLVTGVVNNGNSDTGIARLREDGSLDPGLDADGDADGRVLIANGGGNDHGRDVVLLDDGDLLVAGASGGDMGLTRLDGFPVGDWSSGITDWTNGADMFGACLRAVAAGAATSGSTWSADGDGDCADGDADPWRAVPTSVETVAVTAATGTEAAEARLRFGFRTSGSQRVGTYVAPLLFEVAAPAA